MTEQELIKSFWWWRKTSKCRVYDERTGTTKFTGSVESRSAARRKELAAWRYELAKRHDRGAGLPPIREAEALVRELEDAEPEPASINPIRGIEGLDEGRVSLPAMLNPRASNRALMKAHLEDIKRMRRMQGIRRTQGPEGHRNRPVSWRYVEVLDLKHYYPRQKLSPGDQRMWRKAKRFSKHCYDHLQES